MPPRRPRMPQAAVRMVLFWDMFQPTEEEWNETAFDTLSTAVERAKAAGLYVILDCVHMSGDPDGQEHVPAWARVDPDATTEGLDAVVENGLGFLQTIADRYKDEPAIAAYDPVNEPFRTSTRSARLMSDYTRIVNAIRAKDGVTSIMLEPSYGDAKVPASSFSSLTPTSRANLIWSVHDYYNGASKSGYTAGYDDSTGLGMDPNPSDGTTGYNAADKAALATHCRYRSTRPRRRACRSGSGSSASATAPPATTSTSRTRSRSTSPRASTTPGGSTTPTAATARSAWSTRMTPGGPGSA
ncbi:glycoside hydrolase family 5 protein [Actinoallomurus sp. CA-142502]|uniref:glycoside hydrolase family 5 protein n=1 Tax=Actinoallomurus sp. CA-142502 TaxID=3239885 RepID=UPI003D929C45